MVPFQGICYFFGVGISETHTVEMILVRHRWTCWSCFEGINQRIQGPTFFLSILRQPMTISKILGLLYLQSVQHWVVHNVVVGKVHTAVREFGHIEIKARGLFELLRNNVNLQRVVNSDSHSPWSVCLFILFVGLNCFVLFCCLIVLFLVCFQHSKVVLSVTCVQPFTYFFNPPQLQDIFGFVFCPVAGADLDE